MAIVCGKLTLCYMPRNQFATVLPADSSGRQAKQKPSGLRRMAFVLVPIFVALDGPLINASRGARSPSSRTTMMTIPIVTSPITAAIVITVPVPADHDSRLRIYRRRRINHGRRRRCVDGLRRDINRCRHAELMPTRTCAIAAPDTPRPPATIKAGEQRSLRYLVHLEAHLNGLFVVLRQNIADRILVELFQVGNLVLRKGGGGKCLRATRVNLTAPSKG